MSSSLPPVDLSQSCRMFIVPAEVPPVPLPSYAQSELTPDNPLPMGAAPMAQTMEAQAAPVRIIPAPGMQYFAAPNADGTLKIFAVPAAPAASPLAPSASDAVTDGATDAGDGLDASRASMPGWGTGLDADAPPPLEPAVAKPASPEPSFLPPGTRMVISDPAGPPTQAMPSPALSTPQAVMSPTLGQSPGSLPTSPSVASMDGEQEAKLQRSGTDSDLSYGGGGGSSSLSGVVILHSPRHHHYVGQQQTLAGAEMNQITGAAAYEYGKEHNSRTIEYLGARQMGCEWCFCCCPDKVDAYAQWQLKFANNPCGTCAETCCGCCTKSSCKLPSCDCQATGAKIGDWLTRNTAKLDCSHWKCKLDCDCSCLSGKCADITKLCTCCCSKECCDCLSGCGNCIVGTGGKICDALKCIIENLGGCIDCCCKKDGLCCAILDCIGKAEHRH